MARFSRLLAVPGARRLLVAALIADLPSGMLSLAIVLLVREETGSFASAGLAVGAFTLCGAAAGPIQGALVDRHGARAVLLPCSLLDGAALTSLVIAAKAHLGVPVVPLAAGVAGALFPIAGAYTRVLWPALAPDSAMLEVAYQLHATAEEVIFGAGPLLVALVVAAASPAAAVAASAVVGIAGIAMFVTGPLPERSPGSDRRAMRPSALASRGLRLVLATTALVGVGMGAVEVGLTALAVVAGSPQASGVLLALWATGSLMGGLFYGMRARSSPLSNRYPALLLAIALTAGLLVLPRSLGAAIPLSLLAGAGYAPMFSCEDLIVAAVVPESAATQAFACTTASTVAGIAAGSALSGALVQGVGVPWSFALATGAAVLAAALAVAGRGRFAAPELGRVPLSVRNEGRVEHKQQLGGLSDEQRSSDYDRPSSPDPSRALLP